MKHIAGVGNVERSAADVAQAEADTARWITDKPRLAAQTNLARLKAEQPDVLDELIDTLIIKNVIREADLSANMRRRRIDKATARTVIDG